MCFEDKPLATVQADTPSDDEEVPRTPGARP